MFSTINDNNIVYNYSKSETELSNCIGSVTCTVLMGYLCVAYATSPYMSGSIALCCHCIETERLFIPTNENIR